MTIEGNRILVVDDEPQIRKFLRIALDAHGYAIAEAATGREGVRLCANEGPDLVILDLGLPDMDGKEVVAAIREWSSVPILVLSVRQSEAEKVAALDAGAEDYVVKPFGIAEILARIRALLRSRRPAADGAQDAATISVNGLTIDFARHEVSVDGRPVRLTRKEFDLLGYLARHAGRVVTHRQILHEVWGKAHEQDLQYLRVFIGQLRHKLGDDAAHPRYLLNEPGVGYRLID